MVNNQYVKFVKGTLSAYENCSKDPNTLYFITDSNGDISLYLGANLISSSIPKEEVITLTQLADVMLKSDIEANSVLVYNDSTSQWEDVNLEDLSTLLSIPTTEEIQEVVANVVSEVIDGAPETFDTLKEISDWIKEDETGTEILINRVGSLETEFEKQAGEISNLQTAVGDLDSLTKTHTSEISNLQTSVGDLNTLTQAQSTNITNLQTAVGDLVTLTQTQSTNITNLQTSVGDLGTLTQTHTSNISNLQDDVEELQEIIRDLTVGGDVDLAGYVKTAEFVATVGKLSDLIREDDDTDTTNLVNEINKINARISWQTLEEI